MNTATPPMMFEAFIGFGSNMMDPEEVCDWAVAHLSERTDLCHVRVSPRYWTEPVGYDDQAPFLNAVIALNTSLAAIDLLHLLLSMELLKGRTRTFKNGPRVLDLDLLWHTQAPPASSALVLPHPRMHERLFVMQPLADLAPDRCFIDGFPNAQTLADDLKQRQPSALIAMLES